MIAENGAVGVPPRRSLRSRLLAALWSLFLRLHAATWGVRSEGLDVLDEALSGGRSLLAVFWHGKYLPLFVLLRGRRALIFTSASPRGDVIAEICRRFGYSCAQIPDHGRQRSLEQMRTALAGTTAGAVVVDGPRGPYHVVKRGAVVLASEQGRCIFPASVAASRKKVAAGRWDRMEIPKLFSRVVLVVGPPFELPASLTREEEARWQDRIRVALEEADRRAEVLLAAKG